MAAELASTRLNAESHLLLEQPFLKVPYELSRKNFKNAQRHVERDRDQLLLSLKITLSQSRSGSQTAQNGSTARSDTTLADLDSMIQRMESLKRKLESLHLEEKANHEATRARILHLQALHDIPSIADVKYDEWSKVRLNRLLVDYLLRLGYGNSAKTFARETGIENLVDVEAFMQCSKVERSLHDGRTSEALNWCSENRQNLKRTGNTLEFELRLQQYIELVRSRTIPKLLEATAHAKKYLTSPTDPTQSVQAAGLLAFPPSTPIEPYKSLYSHHRYTYLSALFVKTHHSLFCLPALPALHVALSAGLSALKTPSCHSIHAASSGNVSTSTSGTSVCPICSTELNELARNVPYAHHAKSSVENDPVVLPNGRIYGRERLMRLNEKMVGGPGGGLQWTGDGKTGEVRDPMDNEEVFHWDEVAKVYIS